MRIGPTASGPSAHNCPIIVTTLMRDSEIVLREDSSQNRANYLNLALVVLSSRDCKAVQIRDLQHNAFSCMVTPLALSER